MRWLSVLNLSLLSLSGIVIAFLLFVTMREDSSAPLLKQLPAAKIQLPQNPFGLSEEAFEKIDAGILSLKWVEPKVSLPDLRNEVIFCRKNDRPDIDPSKALFHLSLRGSGESRSIAAKERLYLVYEGDFSRLSPRDLSSVSPAPLFSDPGHSFSKGNYTFSPDNKPTPLWIELVRGESEGVEICTGMTDEQGLPITSPAEVRYFTLRPQETQHNAAVGWELGGYRVDATLLVRQKARWVGQDLFLEKHGGEDFADAIGRERVDFLDGPSPYSCFVRNGDFLVWKEGRWMRAEATMETDKWPLLVVKKIDDKVMSFELWDCEGRGKLMLSLIRAHPQEKMPDITNEFKFVGAKTWAQFIVENNSERLLLKPNDWLVFTSEGGWQKIESPQQVDDYVEQRLKGPLFILDKMVKKNGHQVLVGHLFNCSRTEIQEVELRAIETPLINYPPTLTLSVPPLEEKPFGGAGTHVLEQSEIGE